jgi:uncharacterized protein (DUF433 family)
MGKRYGEGSTLFPGLRDASLSLSMTLLPFLRNISYKMTENLLSRITFNIRQCGGKPCVRGMRIRVADVLALLAEGLSAGRILEEMPDLEAEDIQVCLVLSEG